MYMLTCRDTDKFEISTITDYQYVTIKIVVEIILEI